MAIGLQNTDNIDAPGGNYPYGRVKDNDGTGNGTPANRKTLGDFHQYFARLMALAGITPNGLPENSADGFQYVTALLDVISRQIGDPQSTDLNNLLGVCIANVNNAYTNAPSGLNSGHIIVSYIPTGNEVRQRVIDHTNGATWTRLFNGSWSAWVRIAQPIASMTWTNITLINGWANVAGTTAQYAQNSVTKIVHLKGVLNASGASSGIFADTGSIVVPKDWDDQTGTPAVRIPISSEIEPERLSLNTAGWQISAFNTARTYYLTGVSFLGV